MKEHLRRIATEDDNVVGVDGDKMSDVESSFRKSGGNQNEIDLGEYLFADEKARKIGAKFNDEDRPETHSGHRHPNHHHNHHSRAKTMSPEEGKP